MCIIFSEEKLKIRLHKSVVLIKLALMVGICWYHNVCGSTKVLFKLG